MGAILKKSAKKSAKKLPVWDLSDLYSGLDCRPLKADKKAVLADGEAFAKKYQGKLQTMAKASPNKLALAIGEYEKIVEKIGKLASYATLLYAADSIDSKIAKFYADIHDIIIQAQTNLIFFSLELNKIAEPILEKAIKSNKSNGRLLHYKPFLQDLRLELPFQLESKLEKLFLEKSAISHSFVLLFDEIMANMQFNIKGKNYNLETALSFLQDSKSEKRKLANDALINTFKQQVPLLTRITNSLAKDKEIDDTWRGFQNVDHSRHVANKIDPFIVETMVKAVQNKYADISHRYYRIKARLFGVKALNHWDRNAPLNSVIGNSVIGGVKERKIAWHKAKEIVLCAYGEFSPQMEKIAAQFFNKNWIDVPTRQGKRSGAFSHGTVPSVHPYILLNYQSRPRDVSILAHELGHGIHQVLAAKQGALMADTPLTIAETASVFGEMLTFKKLLSQTKNINEKRILLGAKIEDMINTVIRQISFYIFEKKLHEKRRQTGELTSEQISQLWLSVQKESLGDSIKLGEGYETFWCYIPHFIHSPFYVYAYAFGDCLVNSIYAVYEKSKENSTQQDFIDKYIDMLSAGGSRRLPELLKPFNLDAEKPDFWYQGLAIIEGFIDEFAELEKK